MELERTAYLFAVPFMVLGGLMALERALIKRGSIAAMRLAIPIGGWSENVGVEIPASLAPSKFPTLDNLAPGTGFDSTVEVRARWLNDSLIAFWDERARGGVNTSGLVATALLAFDRSGGTSGTVLKVRRYVRVLPGLTVLAALVAFTILPGWTPPWEFIALVALMFGGITVLTTVLAVRKLRTIYEEISAELVHRATTGRPTFEPDDPLPEVEGRGSIRDLFG